jgi:general secretion pathway protein A
MRARAAASGIGGGLPGLLIGLLVLVGPAYAADEVETAEILVKLVKTGRIVVSDNQALINDASKGDKGFTADAFRQKTAQKFLEATKIDLRRPASSQQTKLLQALLEAPAVWNRRTGERFQQKTGIQLKLTNADYRNPNNKPDDFESEVLNLFADASYPKGKEYTRTSVVGGKPVLRYMSPEYASKACLSCHGEPKGERDITGGKKEGWKEGGLAGAISLIIPVR